MNTIIGLPQDGRGRKIRPVHLQGLDAHVSRHLISRSTTALRNFRTVDGDNLLRAIAQTENLNRTSLAHLKSFLSGVFSYARRRGILNNEKPMTDIVLPQVTENIGGSVCESNAPLTPQGANRRF